MHGQGAQYVVRVPDEHEFFMRLLDTEDCGRECFRSRAEMGKPRLWPGHNAPGEDMVGHFGISAFLSVQAAIQTARSVNERRAKDGQPPRWTHLVEFTVNGHQGQACAEHGSEAHFFVWGESEALASTAGDPVPIPTGRR